MPFFAMAHRVLFHDTMAYGSHHYVTNFKFQNLARETILFESRVAGESVWRDQLADLVLLTRDAYSLNLSPVELGGRVGILLTYEEPTHSTVRLCFRVVGDDGRPVSCGFQTMVCIHRETMQPVRAPRLITQHLDAGSEASLLEPLTSPPFVDRLKTQGAAAVKAIFPESIRELGRRIATARGRDSHPKIVDERLREYSLDGAAALPRARRGVVFTFPGQGSYRPSVLRELRALHPDNEASLRRADEITRDLLGQEFLRVVSSEDRPTHDRLLEANPAAAQVGIYLAAALIARELTRRGIEPELLVGHSFGEYAAQATAGVVSIDGGVEIVCKRLRALEEHGVGGGMSAVSCDRPRAEELLEAADGASLELVIHNHPRQVVVAGMPADLERLAELAARQGVSATRLASLYPFHSSHLAGAAERFRRELAGISFDPPKVPIFRCAEGALQPASADLPALLSRQLVTGFDFAAAVSTLREAGYGTFVECGGCEILTGLVRRNRPDDAELQTVAVGASASELSGVLDELAERLTPPAARSSRSAATVTGHAKADPPRADPAPSPPARPAHAERPVEMPMAIVAMECILPGAASVDEFWHNVEAGVSGIVDLGRVNPDARRDFQAGSVNGEIDIVPDKSYSLLHGHIAEIPYDPRCLSGLFSEEEYQRLTRAQRLLALTLARCLRVPGLVEGVEPGRIQCILGSTADGSGELDDALFLDTILAELDELDEPPEVRQSFARHLEEVVGYRRGEQSRLAQHPAYREVVGRLLDERVTSYVVDSACSSSLYAVNLGMKALRSRQADLALVGGVFAPGPANNVLFAQFRGLSPTGSRPLDRTADGVVFGDGAALLAIKRLPDALAADDRVLGVIRGMGLSSDGKSPSINVPRAAGQRLAVRRALERAGADPDTIQYVEAHATATPVGDRIEVEALSEIFDQRDRALAPVEVSSVKSLIGHTGWVSGAASMIKVCKAFEEGKIPKHHNFRACDPDSKVGAWPFSVADETRDWAPNVDGRPRRAGVSAFGFGGTNAHLVIEEFEPAYHRRLEWRNDGSPPGEALAVVGVGGIFPDDGGRRFPLAGHSLPRKKLLLPDVTEHMDASQFLVALAAEKVLDSLPWEWASHRDEIGVVLGLESKTQLGIDANRRIFLDRLERLLREGRGPTPLAEADVDRVLERLRGRVREGQIASGPYTLPGLMPNVTASRVCGLFDLQGPNLVIDKGGDSLFQALRVAEDLLAAGDCNLILAGGVNVMRWGSPESSDAVLLLGLMTESAARERQIPIVATLRPGATAVSATEAVASEVVAELDCRGATGATDLVAALNEVGKSGGPRRIRADGGAGAVVGPVESERSASPSPHPTPLPAPGSSPPSTSGERAEASAAASEERRGVYDVVRGTPIYRCTPVLRLQSDRIAAASLEGRRLLVLSDQPRAWAAIQESGALGDTPCHAVFPAGRAGAGGTTVDLATDESLRRSLAALDATRYDTIVALQVLADRPVGALVERDPAVGTGLLELLFAVARHEYERIGDGRLPLLGLSLGSASEGRRHPNSALIGGFLKSVARELPDARVRAVGTDATDVATALGFAAAELARRDGPVESWYLDGRRHLVALEPLDELAVDHRPWLDESSVVVASGGARGVTAVLAEELLRRVGCTVVGLGRTDPEAAPEELRRMSEAELRQHETDFYRQELAAGSGLKLPELKRRWASYCAAAGVARALREMAALGGTFDYRRVDLLDAEAVDRTIGAVYERYGRVDLILHGAGVQSSAMLPKKTLEGFRRIVATKLAGLAHLYRSVESRRADRPVHYHALTSAFSYLGNDGQPDYGAANEAMNGLAEALDDPEAGVRWTSLAWLGWAGIGMTSGSEFAALAANRRLRGVTREEGAAIFSELLDGAPAAPINVLLADGEMRHYDVSIEERPAEPSSPPPSEARLAATSNGHWEVFPQEVSLASAPFLADHRVNGIPTAPAAFLTCLVSQAAQRIRPDLKIVAYENTRYRRFVRVPPERGVSLRVRAREISANGAGGAAVRVEVLSDFVHKSGVVLQRDIVHCETVIRMANAVPQPPDCLLEVADVDGRTLPDPYVLPGSMVRLDGPFASTRRIEVDAAHRVADYLLAEAAYPESAYGELVPNMVMVDAFWRFGTVQEIKESTFGVYVPERCGVMKVYFDYLAFDSDLLRQQLTFRGYNPRAEGDLLHVGPIEVCDPAGNVLLVVEDGLCRKFGEIDALKLSNSGPAQRSAARGE